MRNLYLDCEWFQNQKIFLIGWAYSIKEHGQLYDASLTRNNIIKLLRRVDGFVYFYGPDIAMIEKNFRIDIRNNFCCVNLLRLIRKYNPHLNSYKLSEVEKYYLINRSVNEYKLNIFRIFKDWFHPVFRNLVLQYNNEDVLNLVRVKRKLFSEQRIYYKKIAEMALK
jgi:uncharacterized protein YprB with RNaseH-like and TPR domain